MATQLETEVHTQSDTNDMSLNPSCLMYCGLDPLIHVFQRLFIKDVQNLENTSYCDPCNHEQGQHVSLLCHRNGRPVTRVDLIGLVIMVESKRGRWSCVIDDGTCVIMCNKWTKDVNSQTCLLRGLTESLKMKQNQMASLDFDNVSLVDQQRPEPCCAIGDIVRIRGRVLLYAGHKEIDILSLQKLDSPVHEINRVLELPKLYTEFYDKQVCLPSKIKQDIENNKTQDELIHAVQSFIEIKAAEIDSFKSNDVLEWPSITKTLNSTPDLNKSIQDALDQLGKTSGLICELRPRGDSREYEIIKSDCRLCHVVLDIVQVACRSGQNKEKGCHYLHIMDKLRHFSDYSLIQDCVVEKVLTLLECDSEIVCVETKRYLAVN